jgi:transmembrane sensor
MPVNTYMDAKEFHSVLKKYLAGEATQEESQMIDEWYRAMGNQKDSSLSNLEDVLLEKRHWSALSSHIKKDRKLVQAKSVTLWRTAGIAASVVMVLASFFYFYVQKDRVREPTATTRNDREVQPWTKVENTKLLPQLIALPDGSKITLEPKSTLRYLSLFKETQREVYLEGEAFFDIVHNPKHPFLVHTSKVITRVLGTSFRVKDFSTEKNILVAVKSGKVLVYKNQGTSQGKTSQDEIILTPNQQILYDKEAQQISRMMVENPQPLLREEEVKRMRFDAAPVAEIFNAIEKVYGVDIVFDKETFSACTLTTSISDGGIYNRLDIICKTIGATYSIKEYQIIIEGAGCN